MLPKAFLAAALASSATAYVLLPPDVQPVTNIEPSVFEIPESDNQAPEPQVPEVAETAEVPEAPKAPEVPQPHEGHHDHPEGTFQALPFEEGHRPPFPDPREAAWTAVNCPGCPLTVYKSPFDDKDNTTITLPDAPNHLILRVDIDHTESGDRLLVNGFEMFPDIDIINGHLSAPQVPSGPPRSHEKLRKHKSGKAAKEARSESKDRKEKRKFRHEGKVKHVDETKAHEGEFHHEVKEGEFRHHGEDKFHHMDHHEEHPHHEEHHEEHHDEIKAHGEENPTEAPAPAPTSGDDLPPPPPPHGDRPPFDGPPHHPHHHPDDGHPPPPPGKFVEVPLGFSLMRHTIGKDAEAGDDFEKISLTLQIIAVNGDLIGDIPAVSIFMDRTTDGKLLIGRVGVEGEDERPLPPPHNHPFGHHLEGEEMEGFEGHHPHHPHDHPHDEPEDEMHAHGHHGHHDHPHDEPEGEMRAHGHHGHGMDMSVLEEKLAECTNFLCRWKVMAEAHVKPHKCGGKGKGKAHHNHHNEDMEELKGQEEDGEFKGHHHHHHHHEDGEPMHFHHMHGHEHSLGGLLRKFSSHVLVPVFIGIAAGVMVSFVGMVVGSLIVTVWRMLFRSSARHVSVHHHAKVAPREPAALEEKAGLMAQTEDDLPPYEDEHEVKEVNEKA